MPARPVAHEGNRVTDHYPDLADFEADLRLAGDRARTPHAGDFVRALNSRWKQYGDRLYLSSNQANFLRKIANSAD